MHQLLGPYSDYTLTLLRIVAGFLFLCHGAQKFGLIQDERPILPSRALAEATQQQGRPKLPVGPDIEVSGTRAPTTWIEQLRLPVGRTLLAGVIELVGGAFMMVGLLTSSVAFVASGLMAFAYFLVHAPQGFYPLFNKGEPAVLFCFIWLFFRLVHRDSSRSTTCCSEHKATKLRNPAAFHVRHEGHIHESQKPVAASRRMDARVCSGRVRTGRHAETGCIK